MGREAGHGRGNFKGFGVFGFPGAVKDRRHFGFLGRVKFICPLLSGNLDMGVLFDVESRLLFGILVFVCLEGEAFVENSLFKGDELNVLFVTYLVHQKLELKFGHTVIEVCF